MIGAVCGTHDTKTDLVLKHQLQLKSSTGHSPLSVLSKVIVHIVNCIARCRLSSFVNTREKLLTKDVIIGIRRCLFNYNRLFIVGYLEDDELDLVGAFRKSKGVGCSDALLVNRDTVDISMFSDMDGDEHTLKQTKDT